MRSSTLEQDSKCIGVRSGGEIETTYVTYFNSPFTIGYNTILFIR